MRVYRLQTQYDRNTGEKLDHGVRVLDHEICDLTGVVLNPEDDFQYPYVSWAIEDTHDSEPYYHEHRLQFTAEEAKELLDIDWDESIDLDLYDVFDTKKNPYMYCNECDAFLQLMKKAVDQDTSQLQEIMAEARVKMIEKVIRDKRYSLEELSIEWN